MKPLSNHEIRVLLLNKEDESVNKILQGHRKEWKKYGCSIMLNSWKNKVAKKDIINFLVNSPKGSVFLRSIDASKFMKTAGVLFKCLDDVVEEIGEQNVIQVVTDNASNYVAIGNFNFRTF